MSETKAPSMPSMTRWRRVYYLIPVVALVIPFFANEYLLWVVNAILVYTLVTVGFNLILGNLGQLAFANTAFFGIGAYTVALLADKAGVPVRVNYWESPRHHLERFRSRQAKESIELAAGIARGWLEGG